MHANFSLFTNLFMADLSRSGDIDFVDANPADPPPDALSVPWVVAPEYDEVKPEDITLATTRDLSLVAAEMTEAAIPLRSGEPLSPEQRAFAEVGKALAFECDCASMRIRTGVWDRALRRERGEPQNSVDIPQDDRHVEMIKEWTARFRTAKKWSQQEGQFRRYGEQEIEDLRAQLQQHRWNQAIRIVDDVERNVEEGFFSAPRERGYRPVSVLEFVDDPDRMDPPLNRVIDDMHARLGEHMYLLWANPDVLSYQIELIRFRQVLAKSQRQSEGLYE